MATVAPTAAHAAAVTVNVQVGGDSLVRGVGFEGMRFFAPPTFTVHQGDTITFNFAGFHTATLLPAGVGADDWRIDNAGPTGPYSLIQPDTDNSEHNFQFNKAVAFPTDPTCGTSSTPPCSYTGSLLNSGLPQGNPPTFSATINEPAGTTFWVICLVHSMMQMRVQVVDSGTATTTQTQINNYQTKTLAADKDAAGALVPKLEKQTGSTVNGHWVWDAYAGFDGNGWGLDAMFPHTLHVKLGQSVRWHFSQLLGNVHTVTFPKSSAVNFANNDFSGQRLRCDPGEGAPNAAPPVFCSPGGPGALEIEIRGAAVTPQGGGNYYGTGLHSSGVRGPDGLSTDNYRLTFQKRTSTGWKYACAIHGGMMDGIVYVS